MQIKMKLLSDTCPSSGEGFAGVVDLDVPCDKYGIPYIPAKRIKGCLREAALELRDVDPEFDPVVFDRLFGKPGGDEGILHLSNGYIENYEAIVKELDELFQHPDYRTYLNSQSIINYYTTMRSQTSIDPENQTAQDHTLRTMRLIKAGNVFYFNVTMMNDEKCVYLLKKCCKVLRRIGLNRTRGWGEVKCEFDETNQEDEIQRRDELLKSEKDVHQQPDLFLEEDLYQLHCTFTLKSQLMVINKVGRAAVSDNYIPGSHILGVFAAEYIRQYGHSTNAHEDTVFRELFLSNQVKFLNAYLVDEDGNRCLPLPVSIVKKKDDDNKLYDLAYDDDYKTVINESIQTTKWNGYCSPHALRQMNVKVFQVQQEVEYHHQRPNDRTIGHAQEGNGQFFQMEVLSPGQTFKGLVLGKVKHLQLLKSLMKDCSVVRLGRSKTAQYAEAVMEMGDVELFKRGELGSDVPEEVSTGQRVVITLTSPMILLDEDKCVIRPDPKCFVKLLCKKYPGFVYERSFIRVIKVSGYNAKWGMPKTQMDALDAGSVIVMRYEGEETLDIAKLERDSYGLRQNEGFGRIIVQMHGHNKVSIIEKRKEFKYSPPKLIHTRNLLTYIQQEIIFSIIRKRALDVYREKLFKETVNFSHSMVYKLMAMLEKATSHEQFVKMVKNVKKDEYQFFVRFIEEHPSIAQEVQKDFGWRVIEKTVTNECNGLLNDSNFELNRLFYETILQQMKWQMRKPQKEEVKS